MKKSIRVVIALAIAILAYVFLRPSEYLADNRLPPGKYYVEPLIYLPRRGAPHPTVVFVPGSGETYNSRPQVQLQSFTQWGEFLASHGFATLFLNTAEGADRVQALLEGVSLLSTESQKTTSPLFQKIDSTKIVVMGHSFGGAAALDCANRNELAGLKAVVALAPVRILAGSPYFLNIKVPTLIISGEGDPSDLINTGKPDSPLLYEKIPPGVPKLFALFKKEPVSDRSTIQSHLVYKDMHHVADTPLGMHPNDPHIANLALSFLMVFVKGDLSFKEFLKIDSSMADFKASL